MHAFRTSRTIAIASISAVRSSPVAGATTPRPK